MSDKNLRFLLFGEDKTASSTFGKTADHADSATNRIGGVFSKMGSTVGGEVGSMLTRVGDGFTTLGDKTVVGLGAKFMALGGVVAGVGMGMQAMASKDQQAHQQLTAAVEATGKAYDNFDGDVEKQIATQEKYGHKATDTQEALRVLTQAFQDPKVAMEQMNLVQDLAAAKHMSLAAAAATVAKVHGGSAKVLKEFGIVVEKNADGTKNMDGAMEKLSARLTGQASAASDTFSGKLAGMRAKVEDVGAQVAGKLGPALTTVGPVLLGVGAIMESKMVPALAKTLAGWVSSGAAATVSAAKSLAGSVVVVGGWIASAATATLAGAEMAAAWVVGLGPVAWIIAAVVGIGAALVLAYNKVSWFRDAVDGAWSWMKAAATGVKDWIVGAWNDVTDFFTGAPSKIGAALSTVADFITKPFRTAFNTIGSLWNGTVGKMSFTVPDWVPGLGGKGFSMPQIPMLASGTNNFAGGLAIVGENGRELVHLPSGSKVDNAQQTASMLSGGGGGGATIHIDNYNEAHHPPQVIASEFAFLMRTK